jgi:uncharacterized protein YqcC (DUF446 family)
MKPNTELIAKKIAEIEAEMKKIRLWQDEDLPAEKYENPGFFGIGSMSFVQWLQFIFIPTVKRTMASGEEFPDESQVALQAIKEFVAWPAYDADTEDLVKLLEEFDDLFH